MRSLLVHIESIEKLLNSLNSLKAYTFATGCAERSWPIYQRASEGKSWGKQSVLRSSLERVWEWLNHKCDRPAGFASKCEDVVTEADLADPVDSAAYYVANGVFGLMAIIENDQPQFAYQNAQGNLDLLDAFLYEYLGLPVSSENDGVVDSHELMVKEMQQQVEDLKLLQEPLTTNLVSHIRKRSEGKSILGDLWYEA